MKETTSLYNLLKRGVVIPNFQRDYAQGRAGKEDLRTKFLDEIWAHVGKDTAPLELDFVYGTNMDGKICPLDGQQRLTTIWLLMWYCKYKGLKEAMKLAKEMGKGSILICLSGRGDKDMDYIIENYGIR